MSNKKQTIPKWFKGTIYEKGATVRNRFSGDEYELNALELSMYDFIMGATTVVEMQYDQKLHSEELIKNLRKGLNWFRTHNAAAYMVLLLSIPAVVIVYILLFALASFEVKQKK